MNVILLTINDQPHPRPRTWSTIRAKQWTFSSTWPTSAPSSTGVNVLKTESFLTTFSKTSSLNFFIYCFACEGFRTSFKDLIRTSSTWRRPTLMSQSSEVTVVWEERDILARSKVRCVQCELDTTRLFLTNVPEISCFTPWRKCFGNFGGNVTLTFGGKTSQKQRTAFQNSSIV